MSKGCTDECPSKGRKFFVLVWLLRFRILTVRRSSVRGRYTALSLSFVDGRNKPIVHSGSNEGA